MEQPLDSNAVQKALELLPAWRSEGGKLVRQYRFESFRAAMDWMVQAALVAEELDHHPEWTNVFDRVDVALITHSASGITALDFELAQAMERLAQS